MRPISEDDVADYRQQDAEERERARLERRGMMGGPEAPEPCERCDGEGRVEPQFWTSQPYIECPRCLGTGVQP